MAALREGAVSYERGTLVPVCPLLFSSTQGRACLCPVQDGAPYTLNPEPWTLNPEPWTLNLEPWTLNPEPWNLNLEPWTLNPEPSTELPRGQTGLCVRAVSGRARLGREQKSFM